MAPTRFNVYLNQSKYSKAYQLLKREYGEFLSPNAEDGFNISLIYDVSSLPEPEQHHLLLSKASLLKRNCFASVFEKYFQFQENGQEGEKRAVIHYREDETLFVFSQTCYFVNFCLDLSKPNLTELLLYSVQFLKIPKMLLLENYFFRYFFVRRISNISTNLRQSK